jgi:hypothetical protein
MRVAPTCRTKRRQFRKSSPGRQENVPTSTGIAARLARQPRGSKQPAILRIIYGVGTAGAGACSARHEQTSTMDSRRRPPTGLHSMTTQHKPSGDPQGEGAGGRKTPSSSVLAGRERPRRLPCTAALDRRRAVLVLHFVRPGRWQSITNFGSEPVAIPAGTVLVTSGLLDDDDKLPADTTAWIV